MFGLGCLLRCAVGFAVVCGLLVGVVARIVSFGLLVYAGVRLRAGYCWYLAVFLCALMVGWWDSGC